MTGHTLFQTKTFRATGFRNVIKNFLNAVVVNLCAKSTE